MAADPATTRLLMMWSVIVIGLAVVCCLCGHIAERRGRLGAIFGSGALLLLMLIPPHLGEAPSN